MTTWASTHKSTAMQKPADAANWTCKQMDQIPTNENWNKNHQSDIYVTWTGIGLGRWVEDVRIATTTIMLERHPSILQTQSDQRSW